MEHDALISNEGTDDNRHDNSQSQAPESNTESDSILARQVFWSCWGQKFLIQLVITVLDLPLLRLVERMVCQSIMAADRDGSNEEACKNPRVQDRVALIMGLKRAFDALPCLLTALCYTTVSNYYGKKFVVKLSLIGQVMGFVWIVILGFFVTNISAQFLWLSSLALFIGGGQRVQQSILYASVCDVVPQSRRTNPLLLLHGADGIAGLVSYPLGSLLMRFHLWLPFIVVGLGFGLQFLLLWYMPEPVPHAKSRSAMSGHTQDSEPYAGSEDNRLPKIGDRSLGALQQMRSTLLTVTVRYADLRTFFGHPGLRIILGIFFLKRIAFASEAFAFQYASEVLYIKIAETFWMGSFLNSGMLLVNSILLPFLTRNLVSPTKDILVIYGSLVDLIGGFAVLWLGRSFVALSIGLFIAGLGEGLEVGLQSLGSSFVAKANLTTFFLFLSILSMAGELLGGPIMAGAYAMRDENERSLGSCFLLSSVLFGFLLVAASLIRTRSNQLER